MINKNKIDVAIDAHEAWKTRLRVAVETGESEFTVAKVRKDNLCDLGKLLTLIPYSERKKRLFKRIKVLHEKFHLETAEALKVALKGNKIEAEKAISPTSRFVKSSAKLISAMEAWKKSLMC